VSQGRIEKTEQGYDQVGYHLLNMRRQQVIPYGFIADNTRYMRKTKTYASLRDFLDASQEFVVDFAVRSAILAPLLF
jgi:hypothetical protein